MDDCPKNLGRGGLTSFPDLPPLRRRDLALTPFSERKRLRVGCGQEPRSRAHNDRAGTGHPEFPENTAAFVHELPSSGLSNVDGERTYARVQVLTNAGALDRDKQLAVVSRLTTLVEDAAGDSSLADRTWVLLTEAPDGGWGLAGHANTNDELIAAARAQIAELRAKKPND
jgi:phenylpyruvate tautomerase PptA (4-oxalocrotonate tautomerase family)